MDGTRAVAMSEGGAVYSERRWWTLGVLCLSLAIVGIGNTVLNIALPTIAREFDASGSQLQWLVDAYSLVFAGLLFTGGAVGDRFGRKGTLTVGLVIFGSTSALATTSRSIGFLIGCRALMGAGAALIMPATLSILTQAFPPRERVKAIGVWAGVAGSAVAIGPILSGWLLEHFFWGSVFFISVPVVIVAIVAGAVLVPASRSSEHVPLDLLGALLSIAAVGSLVYGIIQGPEYGWGSDRTLVAFGIAIIAFAVFAGWELRTPEPMLDLRYFRSRLFSGGGLAISMVFFGMFGIFFLLTQYYQQVRGYDTLSAGLRTLPLPLTMMVFAPGSSVINSRIGSRNTVVIGLACAGTGMLLLARCGLDTGYLFVALSLVTLSAGMAITMPSSTASIMSGLPHHKAGVGSAMNDTSRELGGALGVAVLGSLLSTSYRHDIAHSIIGFPAAVQSHLMHSLTDVLQLSGTLGPQAPTVVTNARAAFVDGMGRAMTVAGVVAYLAAVVVFFMLPRDAAERVVDEEPAITRVATDLA